jgi:hypothetical protein
MLSAGSEKKRIKRIIEFQPEVHKLPNNRKITDFKKP